MTATATATDSYVDTATVINVTMQFAGDDTDTWPIAVRDLGDKVTARIGDQNEQVSLLGTIDQIEAVGERIMNLAARVRRDREQVAA